VTQEFYISVTPVRDGEYLVRTERVAMGVPLAEELVSWSVDRWLNQAVQVMHDPLVGLLRSHRGGSVAATAETETCDLVSLGQELYNALFCGTIRDSWMIAQGVAQNQREVLRLRLGFKDDRLPLLPWEVLHDGARPLATCADVVFSRYRSMFQSSAMWRQATAADQPLRILMVLAAPTDQAVLQLHQEATHLKLELQKETGNAASNLDLTILDQPGREQLTQALEQGHYDILHYAGHSDLSAAGGALYLVSDKTGLTEVLSGDDLAGLLVNNGVRMVVFNSCQGAFTATANDAGSNSGNLADALLKRGVPAVLAMAERIPDDVALNLSRLFYRNLKQRTPIDLGLSRARQGLLSSYGSGQLYWALPILYLHPEFDGYLQVGQQPLEPLEDFGGDYLPDLTPDDAAHMLDELGYADLEGDAADREEVLRLIQDLKKSPNGFNGSGLNGNATVAPPPLTPEEQQIQDAADFNRLGQQLYAQGDLSGAIGAYGDALRLDPESATTYSNLGEALEKFGSWPEALTAYKMALQFEPGNVKARQNLEKLVNGGTSQALVNIQGDRRIAPTDTESTPQQSIYSKSTLNNPPPKSAPAPKLPVKTVATVGATAAVLTSIWFLATRPNVTNPPPSPSPVATGTAPSNSNSGELVTTATQSFSQGDVRRGQTAVEELLNQGALVAAEGALNTVPPAQVENPSISFLRGRLAWESVRRKNASYSIEDARRFWLISAKAQPTNPSYHNVLGFAFHAEGKLDLAKESWEKAASRAAEQSTLEEKLLAEAGQAIVLFRESEKSPKSKNKAIELRDRVMKAAPDAFSETKLVQDWRWSEAAITDWKKLMALK
jgi:tetratricopeptide (TPR) repeat protein